MPEGVPFAILLLAWDLQDGACLPQRFIKLQEELCVSAPLREANRTVSRAEAQSFLLV